LHLALQFKSLQVAALTRQPQARPRFWCLLLVVVVVVVALQPRAARVLAGLGRALDCVYTLRLRWEALQQLQLALAEVSEQMVLVLALTLCPLLLGELEDQQALRHQELVLCFRVSAAAAVLAVVTWVLAVEQQIAALTSSDCVLHLPMEPARFGG
jgi:hypothetical protein